MVDVRRWLVRLNPGIRLGTLLVLLLYLVPLLLVIEVSLSATGSATVGYNVFRPSINWHNYVNALGEASFGRFFINSAIVSVIASMVQLFVAAMAGYALARLDFPGRRTLFLLVVGTIVVPAEVTVVPLFIMLKQVPLTGGNGLLGQGGTGLINTYVGLMVPHLVSPLSIFLMRQFYIGLPDDIGEAARLDGASEWRVFASIYTPLTRPALVVVGLLAFQACWNDFLWPLIVTKSPSLQTLQLGLTIFYQTNATQWSLLMAAAVVITVPVIIAFGVSQRAIRSGVVSSMTTV